MRDTRQARAQAQAAPSLMLIATHATRTTNNHMLWDVTPC